MTRRTPHFRRNYWQAQGHLLVVVLGACAAGIACRAPAAAERTRPVVRVARAFAPLSDRLVEEYRRTLPDLDIRSVDAVDAFDAIQNGTADLGIAASDRAYAGYWTATVQEPELQVRGLSLLQPLSAYVLVRPGSGIYSAEHLTGRVVVLGPKDSTSWTLGNLVLFAVGARPRLIRSVNTRAEGAAALKDGSADATFFPGYTYPDEGTLATIRDGAYLIPIEGPGIDGLRRRHPFVRATAIPRNIYPGQDRVIPTVGLDMVVVCRRDLDEAIVHDLTQQLFDTFPRLSGVEASLRFLQLDRAPATPIPLHPGAARYFRERELSR